jgi:hypothetical protein
MIQKATDADRDVGNWPLTPLLHVRRCCLHSCPGEIILTYCGTIAENATGMWKMETEPELEYAAGHLRYRYLGPGTEKCSCPASPLAIQPPEGHSILLYKLLPRLDRAGAIEGGMASFHENAKDCTSMVLEPTPSKCEQKFWTRQHNWLTQER